jgi:hypothetical protein
MAKRGKATSPNLGEEKTPGETVVEIARKEDQG